MHVLRSRSIIALVSAVIIAFVLTACQTTEPGVKSTMFTQYTTLEVGTAQATKAAEAVLNDLGLHEVKSSSTNLDGWASGTMADKTPVKVTLQRVSDNLSSVSVRVGSTGDTALGKDIIARLRNKLGLKPPSTAPAAETPSK